MTPWRKDLPKLFLHFYHLAPFYKNLVIASLKVGIVRAPGLNWLLLLLHFRNSPPLGCSTLSRVNTGTHSETINSNIQLSDQTLILPLLSQLLYLLKSSSLLAFPFYLSSSFLLLYFYLFFILLYIFTVAFIIQHYNLYENLFPFSIRS